MALQAGDPCALAALYDRYAASLLGVAYRILKDRCDAEDLLHDVFLEVWQQAHRYDPQRGAVSTWLMLRMRSRAIDRARARATARAYGMMPSRPEPTFTLTHDDPSLAPDRARARQAIAQLSEAQRIVLESIFFEGLSYREVAQRCDIPEGTVKSRVAAALAKLRQALRSAEGVE